jgi:hypothetical protein
MCWCLAVIQDLKRVLYENRMIHTTGERPMVGRVNAESFSFLFLDACVIRYAALMAGGNLN